MKDKVRKIVGLLALGAFIVSCSSNYPTVFGSIKGEVRGQKNGSGIIINPPPYVLGATVVLYQADSEIDRKTTKSGKWSFEFDELDEGYYNLSIEKDGFEDKCIDVRVFSGKQTNLSFILTSK